MVFSKAEIKTNLLGCFEIVLFMRSGLNRFENSKQAALRSFLIPVCLLPIVLAAKVILEKDGPLSPFVHFAFAIPEILLTISLFLGVVFVFCKQFKRDEFFCQFVNVMNWFHLVMMALMIPMLVCIGTGIVSASEAEAYAIFVSLMSYIYLAFILTFSLRIPWELGTSLAIASMAIDQFIYDLSHTLRDYLIV